MERARDTLYLLLILLCRHGAGRKAREIYRFRNYLETDNSYKLSSEHILRVGDRQQERTLLSQQASRYFLIRFAIITLVLCVGSYFLLHSLSTPAFQSAYYFGVVICVLSSALSFFLTEWAFDQPRDIFMGVALGSITVRMFNLLFAFAIGVFFIKFNTTGLAIGMFVSYFSLLVIEIAYVHNKGLLSGY